VAWSTVRVRVRALANRSTPPTYWFVTIPDSRSVYLRYRRADSLVAAAMLIGPAHGPLKRDLEEQLKRIRNLYRWGDLAEPAYLTERRRLTDELAALPVAEDKAPSDDAIALACNVGELWDEMTDDERRRFVEEWFEEFKLGRDGAITLCARDRYRELVYSALEASFRSEASRQRAGTQLHHVTVEGLAEWIAWWDAQEASA
jgi:hypothetical protein